MTWVDGDYQDYLNGLGWLEHKPMPPYPRPGCVGEFVYAEEWSTLMQKLDEEDGYNAPNSMLATVLTDLPTPITQRHATLCASVVCWLGTACGQSIVLGGKRHVEHGIDRCHAYLMAWTVQNRRSSGTSGFRMLERLMAPLDHYGRHVFLGPELVRQPEMTADDYETAEHLMVWLGERGEGFILRCEHRIRELNRFEETKRDSLHRQNLAQLGLLKS